MGRASTSATSLSKGAPSANATSSSEGAPSASTTGSSEGGPSANATSSLGLLIWTEHEIDLPGERAADVIVDQMLRPLPSGPLETALLGPAAEAAEVSAPVTASVDAPESARRTSRGVVVSTSLGALAAVGIVVAAVLLRPEVETEPPPVVASATVATPELVAKLDARAATTVHLRVDAALAPEEWQRIEAALTEAGYGTVVVHVMPFSISRSRVGYFREEDRASAEALIEVLRGTHDGVVIRDYRTLIAVPEPGRLDLWIKS